MLALLLAGLALAFVVYLIRRVSIFIYPTKKASSSSQGSYRIAFLHPFANAGGGGERVLWMSIEAVRRAHPKADIFVLCDMEMLSGEMIVQRARTTFGLRLEGKIQFCHLNMARFTSPSWFPFLTLGFQALGQTIMGLECLLWSLPGPVDLLIDTMGCAFAYAPLSLLHTPILAYIHYPFIMMPTEKPHSSVWLRHLYHHYVARWYAACGSLVAMAMVNSSWTYDRMHTSWKGVKMLVTHPPCDLTNLKDISLSEDDREPVIVSLAQFRTEKNHSLQLKVLEELFRRRPEWKGKIKLQLVGGCRPGNQKDLNYINSLRQLARQLGLEDDVQFSINITHQEIIKVLGRASLGIHTMEEEHFGIGIVEMMAAGIIVVAHCSGGPASDIIPVANDGGMMVLGSCGFLASTVDEYRQTIEEILSMPASTRQEIRERARSWVTSQFDGNKFESSFISITSDCLLPLGKQKAT